MIKLKSKINGFLVTTIYFANRPTIWTNLLSTFRSTKSTNNYFCFRRSEINTLINTLNVSDIDLLKSFSKNTTYEIMRSIRDNLIEIDTDATMSEFVPLYNEFATSRNWKNFRVRDEMLNNYRITICKLNNKPIISHLYFLDYNSMRVCLESSVSIPDNINNGVSKSFIGRSNRHLHYADMLCFKNMGFELYDFGGFDNNNTMDEKKTGINKFKSGFNGTLVYESNYVSYPLLVLFRIKKLLRL